MSLTSKTALALVLLLVACNTGKTNLGDLGESDTAEGESDTTDGQGIDCTVEWSVSSPVRNGDWTTGGAVLALEDGLVLGATPTSGDVVRLAADGTQQWIAELGVPGEAFINDVVLDHDGGYLVTIHELDSSHSSRRRARAVRLSPGGEPEWSTDLGAAHYMAWVETDVLVHPQGGSVVSWHDSQYQGLDPRLVLARLDAQGQVLWSVAHPLAEGSIAGADWSHGSSALLGDGSILQLTTEGPGLRLVRTAADGSPVSDAVVEGIEGSPTDLLVLPDGAVLLLATRDSVMVIEVEPDGTVLSTLMLSGGEYSFGDAMAWDPVFEALFVAGSARDPNTGTQSPWNLVVERDGDELYNALVLDQPNPASSALDVSRIPSGGFVVSRHDGALYYETVLPCAGE